MSEADRRHPRRSDSGFTLVELVLVLGIMAVLGAMAVPRYGAAISRYRADAAARRVAADLQQAQRRAGFASNTCSVTFDAAASRYDLSFPAIGPTAGTTTRVDLTAPPYASTIRSVDFGGGATAVTFNGFGIPSSGGQVVVASGRYEKTIRIAATTGALSIE